MKIAIIGHSGSGKSTLAGTLGKELDIPIMHMDTVFWLSGWQMREKEEQIQIVSEFLNKNENWIIDGNYTAILQEERLESADQIIYLNFNRFTSLWRAVKRYYKYRGKSRESMTVGCDEKLDWEFIWWILYRGRNKKKRAEFKVIRDKYPEKFTEIKSQKELENFALGTNTGLL